MHLLISWVRVKFAHDLLEVPDRGACSLLAVSQVRRQSDFKSSATWAPAGVGKWRSMPQCAQNLSSTTASILCLSEQQCIKTKNTANRALSWCSWRLNICSAKAFQGAVGCRCRPTVNSLPALRFHSLIRLTVISGAWFCNAIARNSRLKAIHSRRKNASGA